MFRVFLFLFRVFSISFRVFSFRVFSFSFRVFSISFRVFRFLEDWYFLSRVMVSEPEWGVHGRRRFEVGPSAGGSLVVGWGAWQEERCWSPWQEDP